MPVAIIDYGSGNLHSVRKAVEQAARDLGRAEEIYLAHDEESLQRADRIILPGVGAFRQCREALTQQSGVEKALAEKVRQEGVPFLGICLGMQLMATEGFEHGPTQGLNWIGGEVRALHPQDRTLKVPHMGWNAVEQKRPHPLLQDLRPEKVGKEAYFVHSYHFSLHDEACLIAITPYGEEIAAIVGKDNMVGTQFHPEKSQKFGLAIMMNFLKWRP